MLKNLKYIKRKYLRSFRRFLPKKNFSFFILSGMNKGKRIFTNLHDYPSAILGTTESDLLLWFSNNISKNENWLDIGANYGYTVIGINNNIGANGTIYAFEPVKSTFDALNETISKNSMNNVKSYCLGLSNDNQLTKKNFNQTRGMLTSESLSSDLEVSLISFDSLFEGKKIKKIHGIKIDVDGPELDVLLGLKKLILKDKPVIIIEVHDQSFDKVKNLLLKYGYKKYEIIYKPFYATNQSLENSNLVFHHEKK